ncbi:MAG: carbohydrate ABC transporter permease [Clostridia bacterium]|nr:carbohydrate ABC transporter permease [Clostridia bacterium]
MVKSTSEKAFDVGNIIFMILLSAMFIFPLLMIICVSLSSSEAISKYGYSLIIRGFTFKWYQYIFVDESVSILRAMLNSVFMTVTATVIMVINVSLYSYAVTRPELQMRKFFNLLLVIPMLFAGGTIPYYLIIKNLGLLNSQWAIILPSGVNAWFIMLAKNFFKSLPESLVESAKLEGATNIQVLYKIVVPLAFPIIATIILYTAVAVWNDWFQASLFLDSAHKHLWPVQAVLNELNTSLNNTGRDPTVSAQGVYSAAIVMATLPIVIVYPFLQRFFIGGALVGGVKE